MINLSLKLNIGLSILALCLCTVGLGQLNIDSGVSAADAVQNTLLGEGVTVSNITLSGDDNQVGTFDCVNCNLGLETGVIIGSGNVSVASGPNSSGSSSSGGGNFGASDGDLEILNPGFTFNDAAILEFDFEASGDSIKFNFVWASEEYPEYSGSSFNDTFGFFVSGPGFSGPYSNNAENIAIIPGTTLPVTINNLNNGTNGTTGPCTNCEYYINNPSGGDETVIEYDGFTTVLTAEAEVQCGETYHIKIAVADVGDTGFDSAVFLEAGSFTSDQIEVDLQLVDIAADDSTLFEGCGQANIVFSRPPSNLEEQTFLLDVFGTAENGIDFPEIPDSLTFAEDETELILPFYAFADDLIEGIESVTLSFSNVIECFAESETSEYSFYIGEPDPVTVAFEDVTIQCDEEAYIEVVPSGGFGVYEPLWDNGSTEFGITVSPDETTVYEVTISDTCSVDPGVANVTVTIPDYADLIVDIGPDQELDCLDELVVASSIEGGYGDYELMWMVDGAFAGTDPILVYVTDDEVSVTLMVTDNCDTFSSDDMDVTFPDVEIDVYLGEDYDVTCIDNTELSAIIDGGVGDYTYSWQIAGIEVGSGPTYTVQTDDDLVVTLEVTDQCENMDSDIITLAVPAVPIELDLGPNVNVTCLDEPWLTATVDGGVGGYSYSWIESGEEFSTDASVQVEISGSVVFTLIVEDQCGNTQSDNVTYDIPPVPIGVSLGEDIDVTCVDFTTLDPEVSGGVGAYTYWWTMEGDDLGTETSVTVNIDEPSQVVVFVEDECGNVGADEISLNIPPTPVNISLSLDTAICLGENAHLLVTAEGGAGALTYFWQTTQSYGPSQWVSPEETTTYEVVVFDECGNSALGDVSIGVEEVTANFDFDYVGDWGLQLINNSINGHQFLWEFGNGDVSNAENPYYSFTDLYEHEIVLYVAGELGCVDSISDWFIPEMNIYVPSAFTPNNDGINDFFKVEGHDIFSYNIWIYNRWGQLVWHSNNIDDVWVGNMKGGDHFVQDDVYTYVLKAVGIRENGIEQTGTVTLYR